MYKNDGKDKIIYMDNAATTRLYDEAYEAMLPYLKDSYANPGGIYEYADRAKRAVAGARESIASTLGARPDEIYFTGGGTESDNWALKGVAELAPVLLHYKKGSPIDVQPGINEKDERNISGIRIPHIITSIFEHHAVLNTCKWLEKYGCRVSYIRPDTSGLIHVSDIERHICEDTILISIMHVNNELGTVQSVTDIGALAHERGILFHTDAVAAYGHIPIDVEKMNIDLLSAGGHKFNGPKGTGFLYVDEKIKLLPFMHGGGQEQGRRGGTENVAGIAGMSAAAMRHHDNMESYLERRRQLDVYFIHKLEETGFCFGSRCGNRRVQINGSSLRLPGSFNITIPGIEAEELIVRLGMEGICVSAGAACASSQDGSSHVLKAIGLDRDAANSSIRISLNEDNTEDEIDVLFETISKLAGEV